MSADNRNRLPSAGGSNLQGCGLASVACQGSYDCDCSVQVLTLLSRSWTVDRLDVGDRLNDLAGLHGANWRDVSFADLQRCGQTVL